MGLELEGCNDPLWPFGMKSGFEEKQIFRLRKLVFSHMLGLLPIHSESICGVFPNNLMKTERRFCSTYTCLRGVIMKNCFVAFPLNDEMEWTLLAGIAGVKPGTAKKHFLRTENCLFGTALVKLIDKPGFAIKKNQALTNCFFPCPWLNLPNPPRYLV